MRLLLFFGILASISHACDEQFLENLKKIPRSEKVLFENYNKRVIQRTGLPQEGNYEVFKTNNTHIFRHFSTEENIQKIIRDGFLIAGHKTSFLMGGYEQISYKDLSGVFMTHTDYEASMPYIDFKLPKGTTILKLKEMGAREFIALGNRSWQPWFLKEIEKNPEKFSELLPYRGPLDSPPPNPLKVKIDIVRYSSHKQTLQDLASLAPSLIKGYQLPSDFRNSYYTKRIEPYLNKTSYESPMDFLHLYRGMLISPEDLSSILNYGMKLSRVSWTAGGGGLSFSSNIREASSYIFQSGGGGSVLGVVFKVRKTEDYQLLKDRSLNPGETIYKLHKDLNPEEIEDIYIWGEFGLESLSSIFLKAKKGEVKNHTNWTNQFGFSR